MSKLQRLDEPLNPEERMLYGINVRLEVLIDMFSSFLEVYAKDNGIATTQNERVETKDSNVTDITEASEDKNERGSQLDYSSMTKAEIIEVLISKDIEHTSRMTKAELIELL